MPLEKPSASEPEPCLSADSTFKGGSFKLLRATPELLRLDIRGVVGPELLQAILTRLDQTYAQMAPEQSNPDLLLDLSQLDRITFLAQSALLSRARSQSSRPRLSQVHMISSSKVFRTLIGVYRRFDPRVPIQFYESEAVAFKALTLSPPHPAPERPLALIEDGYHTENVQISYSLSGDTLICEAAGGMDGSGTRHMLDVHERILSRLQAHYGHAFLIMDVRGLNHATAECFQQIRSQRHSAMVQKTLVCIIVRHLPRAVDTLCRLLLRNQAFRLKIVGTPEEAKAAITSARTPIPASLSDKQRLPASPKVRIALLEAENTRLLRERKDFVKQAGQMLGNILLHQGEPDPEAEFDLLTPPAGPYQEIYEGIALLQAMHQDYFRSLQQEIDERKHAEQQAQEHSQLKSRFLASVSHELRTPLNALLGFSQVILSGRAGELNAKQLRFLERIQDNGLHLLTLINDVLDITRIEAGRIQTQCEPVTIVLLLERVLEGFRSVAEDKGLELRLELGADTPETLYTDPARLRQIVSNLVSNAIKFTSSGWVCLRYQLREHPHFPLLLEVEDCGIGIAEPNHKKIFEAFCQVHQGSYPGSGLGLSISLSLAFVLGCQLELISEPGKGSCFRILLPESMCSDSD